MPTTTAPETLGEFFGGVALRNLVEKEPFGGYQVALGPLITTVSPWMFQVGCVLGRALRDRVPTLVKMVPMSAQGPDPEQKISDVLCMLAVERMERYGRRPASLQNFWLKTEFNFEFSDTSVENLKSMCVERVPLKEVLSKRRLDEWLAWGVGFGATYPQLLEELWAKDFTEVDEEAWKLARHYGVALPEHPTPLPLEDVEEDILADTATYTQMYFPELLDSIGLRERLPHAG